MASSSSSSSSKSNDELQKIKKTDEWIVDIEMSLGCLDSHQAKTFSICKVPEKIRDANKEKSEDWFTPKFMAMGPIHRGATIMEKQIMELTKWRYMQSLLKRPTQGNLLLETVERCSKRVRDIDSIVRASYYGSTIDLGRDELAGMMILDACFLLELLLRLIENDTSVLSDFDYIDHDKTKKISRLLTDLVLLENQIPFALLTVLFLELFHSHDEQQQQPAKPDDHNRFSPQKLALSLFECDLDKDVGVDHFLHLIHLCSPDPYQHQDILSKVPVQLRQCATKLQALGITIKTTTSQTNDDVAAGNRESETTVASAMANIMRKMDCFPCLGLGKKNDDVAASNGESETTVASAIREFMDKFEFEIKFDEKKRELIIPTLHIKEATEVKWRNFIAWEQTGRLIGGVGYKFTSYGYFFKGLVCSVRDVKFLRDIGVIKAHPRATDKDLFIMLKSIVTEAQHMDARYREVCKKLNKAKIVKTKGVLLLRMLWYYWWRSMEGLQHGLISLRDNPPWIAVGTLVLALTIIQTIFTILGVIL